MRHSKVRKAWPIMKVKNMFTDTLMLCPADRISRGKISLGTNQPSGPHDHAKPATYAQMKSTMQPAYPLDRVATPLVPNFTPIKVPTMICTARVFGSIDKYKLLFHMLSALLPCEQAGLVQILCDIGSWLLLLLKILSLTIIKWFNLV